MNAALIHQWYINASDRPSQIVSMMHQYSVRKLFAGTNLVHHENKYIQALLHHHVSVYFTTLNYSIANNFILAPLLPMPGQTNLKKLSNSLKLSANTPFCGDMVGSFSKVLTACKCGAW